MKYKNVMGLQFFIALYEEAQQSILRFITRKWWNRESVRKEISLPSW
jgi:hypothetical protein